MARKTQIRRTRRTGGGYGTPGVYFNPDNQHPSSNAAAPSSDPVPGWVRPPLSATEAVSPDALTAPQSGGWRQTRRLINKMRGGFSPALMGSFVANAHAVVVPLALYGLYYLVAQKSAGADPSTRRNKRNNRNNRNRV
uniref:Uncharacterized protein n=1 Tax=viral metagenome TaxID=1070528 RepID=A0A6C0DSQ6_9ZZZZ